MKKKEKNYYFTDVEEAAVIKYNELTDEAERTELFNKTIYPALHKVAECVFNRYHFPYVLNDLGQDSGIQVALTHLATIVNMYNQKRGKAFSFFTFCCKNYLIQQNDLAYKRQLRDWSIDEVNRETGDPDMEVHTVEQMKYEDPMHNAIDMKEFLNLSINYWESKRNFYCTKEFHHKILDKLIEVMKTPDLVNFKGGTGKKDMLRYLRKETGYTTAKLMSFIKKITPLQQELLKEYTKTGKVTGTGMPKNYWDWRTKKVKFQ